MAAGAEGLCAVALPQPKPWGRRGAKRLEVVFDGLYAFSRLFNWFRPPRRWPKTGLWPTEVRRGR